MKQNNNCEKVDNLENPFETSTNSKSNRKTSAEWLEHEDFAHIAILDPDGWNRSNYNYSFNEELISSDEFMQRCIRSTCEFSEPNKR